MYWLAEDAGVGQEHAQLLTFYLLQLLTVLRYLPDATSLLVDLLVVEWLGRFVHVLCIIVNGAHAIAIAAFREAEPPLIKQILVPVLAAFRRRGNLFDFDVSNEHAFVCANIDHFLKLVRLIVVVLVPISNDYPKEALVKLHCLHKAKQDNEVEDGLN